MADMSGLSVAQSVAASFPELFDSSFPDLVMLLEEEDGKIYF